MSVFNKKIKKKSVKKSYKIIMSPKEKIKSWAPL